MREARAAAAVSHPQYLPDLRDRRARRRSVPGDGAARGAGARRSPRRRPDGAGRGARYRDHDPLGARGAAPSIDRASRSEAVERLPVGARRQAARFRAGAAVLADGGRHRAHRARRAPGHAALHGAGAGARRGRRRAHRSLRRRLAAVRDAERPAGLQQRGADRRPARRPARSAARARGLDCRRGCGSRDPARDDEGAEGTLPVGAGDGARSAPLPGQGRYRWQRRGARDDAPDGAAIPHPAAGAVD